MKRFALLMELMFSFLMVGSKKELGREITPQERTFLRHVQSCHDESRIPEEFVTGFISGLHNEVAEDCLPAYVADIIAGWETNKEQVV